MALESSMLALGTLAPDFALPDVVSGQTITRSLFDGDRAFLVMFICRHCPAVKHVQEELARIGADYQRRGLGVVAISSNDVVEHPADRPESLKEMAREHRFTFPFCYDESQDVARAYHAVCTPEFFLFDSRKHLVYRGQLDDSRPNNGVPVTGRDLRAAIEAVLTGRAVDAHQRPSVGCGIKWRKGRP